MNGYSMSIGEILKENKRKISFEVFPPKKKENLNQVKELVNNLSVFKPAFIGCTYGAGGGTSEFTLEISKEIMKLDIPALSHITCVNSTIEEINTNLENLDTAGIRNLLALRGDILDKDFVSDLPYAKYLIKTIKEIYPQDCVGGACYPEKHPDSYLINDDLYYLKQKEEAGCEFFLSQMVFDNDIFYRFLSRARSFGITIPIVPGIMPISSKAQFERSIKLSSSSVPRDLLTMIDKFGDEKNALEEIGIIYASKQIMEFYSNDIYNVHLFTMNKFSVVEEIFRNVGILID